ncbi:MAG: DUF5074 domain-containing protein [Flavobacteriaceae bacterium]
MNKLTKLLSTITILLLLQSCGDDLPVENPPRGDYEHGYFIVNEGPFSNGSGTLTFVDNDQEVYQNVYKSVNDNEDLGNIAQSMYLHSNSAFIVVNNSHQIIVTDRYTMAKIAVIEGTNINNPRFFVAVGNTGYVSNWGNATDPTDDFISIINLETNTISGTIEVGEGPEDMLVVGDKIYVNLQGGYNQNNKVAVIETASNTLSTSIVVGDVPNSIVKDSNGNIWVLCGGKPNWTGSESVGKLVKIVGQSVETTLDFALGDHPEHLSIDGGKLYYNLSGKVRGLSTNDTMLNTDEMPGLDGNYYAMKAENGMLYTTNAADFASEGTLSVFDLSTSTLSYSLSTGIIPTFISFQ